MLGSRYLAVAGHSRETFLLMLRFRCPATGKHTVKREMSLFMLVSRSPAAAAAAEHSPERDVSPTTCLSLKGKLATSSKTHIFSIYAFFLFFCLLF